LQPNHCSLFDRGTVYNDNDVAAADAEAIRRGGNKSNKINDEVVDDDDDDDDDVDAHIDTATSKSAKKVRFSQNGGGAGRDRDRDAERAAHQRLGEAERVLAYFDSCGKEKATEAADLRARIKQARAQLSQTPAAAAAAVGGVDEMDFRNPTKAMITDAKERGIDLNDLEVRR
jgi:hypothetical protein